MARDFSLGKSFIGPDKISYEGGAFQLIKEGQGEYKLLQHDSDDNIIDTLILTKEELRCIFYLVSKQVGYERK